jgi:hypothetical protein
VKVLTCELFLLLTGQELSLDASQDLTTVGTTASHLWKLMMILWQDQRAPIRTMIAMKFLPCQLKLRLMRLTSMFVEKLQE